jgi:hypothetical protein
MGQTSNPNMLFDLSSMIEPVEGLEFLSSPFLLEEINAIVQKMPPDKAPGPDGFNGLFLKNVGLLSNMISSSSVLSSSMVKQTLKASIHLTSLRYPRKTALKV